MQRTTSQDVLIALEPGHFGRLATPEIAMVHQNRIGICSDRRLNQRLASRDTADNTPHLRPPFYLQPIWAIILKFANL